MNNLTILSSPQVTKLRDKIDVDLESYKSSNGPVLPDAGTLLPTTISYGERPELVVDAASHTADDAINAVKVHTWLPALSRTQAADPRLWTTLALRDFWPYMQKRWAVQSASTVRSRYYVTGGRKALNRQGIARLWWGAELTYAPWDRSDALQIFKDEDPARFTRVFFSQQQYAVDLMERNLGGSLLLRISLLAALEAVGPRVGSRDDLSQLVGKEINQLLQTEQLEIRHPEDVRDRVLDLVEAAAQRLGADSAS